MQGELLHSLDNECWFPEKYLNFCMRCGANAKWQDEIRIYKSKKYRVCYWKCLECGNERIIVSYPTQN